MDDVCLCTHGCHSECRETHCETAVHIHCKKYMQCTSLKLLWAALDSILVAASCVLAGMQDGPRQRAACKRVGPARHVSPLQGESQSLKFCTWLFVLFPFTALLVSVIASNATIPAVRVL